MQPTTSDSPTLPELTVKQREVLALVADNRTSKEIAARLGISESAVNQRIEMVRARLGGIPRGELARLYRQEFSIGDPSQPAEILTVGTWEKIHVPKAAAIRENDCTGDIPSATPLGSQLQRDGLRNGSQFSVHSIGPMPAWLSRGDLATVSARAALIFAILIAGMLISAGITTAMMPEIGGN